MIQFFVYTVHRTAYTLIHVRSIILITTFRHFFESRFRIFDVLVDLSRNSKVIDVFFAIYFLKGNLFNFILAWLKFVTRWIVWFRRSDSFFKSFFWKLCTRKATAHCPLYHSQQNAKNYPLFLLLIYNLSSRANLEVVPILRILNDR